MAKQSGGMPKIDEDFMKELISQGVPAKRESQPDDVPQPSGQMEKVKVHLQTEFSYLSQIKKISLHYIILCSVITKSK